MYGSYSRSLNIGTAGIIMIILGIIIGIVAYFIFVKKDRSNYSGNLLKLHDVLNFRKIYLESFIKVLYVISAITIVLLAIVSLFSSGSFGAGLAAFLGLLIGGEIVARLTYEAMILVLKAVSYLRDIRDDAEEIRQYAQTGDSGRTNVTQGPSDDPEMVSKF